MKKKLFQEFKTNGVPYEDLKKMKFLLKGFKLKPEDLDFNNDSPTWPVHITFEDNSVIKFSGYAFAYTSKKGFYYCEYQDNKIDNEEDTIYLSHYSSVKVIQLRLLADVYVEPHSFIMCGIEPDFEGTFTPKKLKEKDKNFVEIIEDKMKKKTKKAKKLTKKLK